MKTATAYLKSISPYSQNRFYKAEKLNREQPDAYEARTWRERLHVDENGHIFIPPMAFKNCLTDAAMYLSMKVKGKGAATFTKHFMAGLLVIEPLVLPLKKENVDGEWLAVPSDGRRGGSKRVEKCFPVIPQWEGNVNIIVVDEIITKDVLAKHLEMAGLLIGIGRFRPRNNGFYGRFKVERLDM